MRKPKGKEQFIRCSCGSVRNATEPRCLNTTCPEHVPTVMERFDDTVTERDSTLSLQERVFSMLPKEKFKRGDKVRVTVELLHVPEATAKCQCQHDAHFGRQELRGDIHSYGAFCENVKARKNSIGTFTVCQTCWDTCLSIHKRTVRILMDGGLIQAVWNVPDDVVLEVFDYDIDGADKDHPNMKTDEAGHPVFVNQWTAADNINAKELAEGL